MGLTQKPVRTDAELAAEKIRDQAAHGLRLLQNLQQSGIQTLWHNAATPQEICDELGTEAAQAFLSHGVLTQAIIQIATIFGVAPVVSWPTKQFVDNPDGTMTIGEDDFVPPF